MKYEKYLTNPDIHPDENVLQEILGRGFDSYIRLTNIYKQNDIIYEWKFYNDVRMWLCKASRKKKTIVWMSASKDFIRATIYFQEKYTDGISKLDLSAETIERIKNTKNTGKSKGCTFELTNKQVVSEFETLLKYKLSLK